MGHFADANSKTENFGIPNVPLDVCWQSWTWYAHACLNKYVYIDSAITRYMKIYKAMHETYAHVRT